MTDKCVVCNGIAEGKPLYKKLGSSDCSTNVFTALHEMQLISLPLNEKDNHYICWDCDESVAEEYSRFIKTETKRKADEVKRKKQDEARNIKLQKKLKLAFKKVHEENLRASGITPPVSKYKMKEKEREENKYHSSHCILCKSSFEDNQGRGYQRFTLLKMVNDEHDVAQVLQKLGVQLDIDLSDEIKRKRFVCCQCYNKMRRDYKSKNKELEIETKGLIQNTCIDKLNEESQDIFKRRPTAEEHAAEIAKLIPPSLANLYKVVTQDETESNSFPKQIHNYHDNHRTKNKKPKTPTDPSVASYCSEDSSNDSSSSSSSESSNSDSDCYGKVYKTSTNSIVPVRESNSKLLLSSTKNNKFNYISEENGDFSTKNNTRIKEFSGISISRNSKGLDNSGLSEGEATSEIIKSGVCNLCGLLFNYRPKTFWYSLNSPMPSVTGVSVSDALQILDSKLAAVNSNVRKKKYVCKPCYSKVCNGFRTQLIQRIAQKKGIAVGQLEASKLKVKGMDSPLVETVKKVNGSCDSTLGYRTQFPEIAVKSTDSYHKKKSKKKDKQLSSRKHTDQSKSMKLLHDRKRGNENCNVYSKSDHRKAVFQFTKCRISHINSPKYVHDMELLKLINNSRHLQYKGKVVILYNVRVNVAEIHEILPSTAFKNEPVRLELLQNVHLYSNLYRNLKNKTGWSTCILCQKTKLLLKETSRWLEDPVAPPNLMVPLRWAQLSLVSSSIPSTKPNIAIEDGKVCSSCHEALTAKFGKFVGAKVAVSHGLSSERIVLDKYKVSFDSNAMNIIADPLEKVVAVKETTKRHKIGPKSKSQAIDQYNAKHNVSSSLTNKEVVHLSKGETLKDDISKPDEVYNQNNGALESQDNVSLDLALSESSESEDESALTNPVDNKDVLDKELVLNEKVSNESPITDLILGENNSTVHTTHIPSSTCEPYGVNNEVEITKSRLDQKSCSAKESAKDESEISQINKVENTFASMKPVTNEADMIERRIDQISCSALENNISNIGSLCSSSNTIAPNSSESVNHIHDEGTLSGEKTLDHTVPDKLETIKTSNVIESFHVDTNKVKDGEDASSEISSDFETVSSIVKTNFNFKIPSSSDSNILENSDSSKNDNYESSNKTIKQIDLSKIVLSVSSSNTGDIDNQDAVCCNDGKSENEKIEIGGSLSLNGTLLNKINESPESSNVSESGCDLGNLILDEIICDNKFSDNEKISEKLINFTEANGSIGNIDDKISISDKNVTVESSFDAKVLDNSAIVDKLPNSTKTKKSIQDSNSEMLDPKIKKQTEIDREIGSKTVNYFADSANKDSTFSYGKSVATNEVQIVNEETVVHNKASASSKENFQGSREFDSKIDSTPKVNKSMLDNFRNEADTVLLKFKGKEDTETRFVGKINIAETERAETELSSNIVMNKCAENQEVTCPSAEANSLTSPLESRIQDHDVSEDTERSQSPIENFTTKTSHSLGKDETQFNHDLVGRDSKDSDGITDASNANSQNIKKSDTVFKTGVLCQIEKNKEILKKSEDVDRIIDQESISPKECLSKASGNCLEPIGSKEEMLLQSSTNESVNNESLVESKDLQNMPIVRIEDKLGMVDSSEGDRDPMSNIGMSMLLKRTCNLDGEKDMTNLVEDHINTEQCSANVLNKSFSIHTGTEGISDMKQSCETESNKENFEKSRNQKDLKRKCDADLADNEMLPKTKKVMSVSNYIENSSDENTSMLKNSNCVSPGNNLTIDKIQDISTNLDTSISNIAVAMEMEARDIDNVHLVSKDTPKGKMVNRGRMSTRNKKRKTRLSSMAHEDKCLSELIDNEKATSVDVVTDYLNAQREKIKELIKPISSEEIKNNAKTCVETVSENLIKIRSKLEKNIDQSSNLETVLSTTTSENNVLQNITLPESNDGQDLSFLSLESDCQVEEIGENTVAPFVQRKKCRGRPPNTSSDSESWSGVSNNEKDTNSEEATSTCYLNIWQSIQGISLDNLLTQDIHQPLRMEQYNLGLVLALNGIRVIIGASLEDLLSWLTKLLPLEYAEKGLEPCNDKFLKYLFTLSQSKEALDPKKLKETLSEDLFVSDILNLSNLDQEGKINEYFVEDIMDESYDYKEKGIQWDDYLAPVNMDNLLNGKESRVSWEQFNNGLLYALWKVNNLLHGDEDNFVKWLSLTSTTPMKTVDYRAMAKAVAAIDKHLHIFPHEINKLVAPIVVKSDKEVRSKSTPSRYEFNQTISSKIADEDDDIILEKITVKSVSNDNKFSYEPYETKRPLCNRLHDAINNANRKRSADFSLLGYPQSKKTARVLPQPSIEALDTKDIQNMKDGNRVSINIIKAAEVKKCQSVAINSKAPFRGNVKGKKLVRTKPGIIEEGQGIIEKFSSLKGRIPVIPEVTGSFSGNSLTSALQSEIVKNIDKNVNIRNKHINISSQSPNILNESLQAQFQQALLNQSQLSIANPASPSENNISYNLSNLSTTGVPMLPVLTASGYVTMIPLSIKHSMTSTSVAGTSHPYNVRSSNSTPDLSNSFQNLSPPRENPKEKELESKVSVLERQLEEIQKQNNQLFELNKKLLKKASTTDDPQVPKDISKSLDTLPYEHVSVPSSSINCNSLQVGDEVRRRTPRTRTRKSTQMKSFEDALSYKGMPKK